jgi:RNA polymerase sigma-70 factor (ECF subfamily)
VYSFFGAHVLTTEADDADLLVLARDDPTGAPFRTIYDRHRDDVYRFLLSLVGSRDLADDLTQETFFRVYLHRDRYDASRPFRPWLFEIARNAGLNALRARRKVDDLPRIQQAASDGVPAQVAAAERAEAARRALATLDPEDRALLLQRVGLGMKASELAKLAHCTERTVRNRLCAALERLTEALLATKGGQP